MSSEIDTFNGRQIIRPGTEILGGVLLTACPIVVDYAENPEPYESLYAKIDTLAPAEEDPSMLALARVTDQIVGAEVWCSEGTMGAVLKQNATERGLHRLGARDEIGLSEFIVGRGGVCYVQALVEGALFSLLQERRGFDGKGSVERVSEAPQAHTWFRHDWSEGSIVMDNNRAFVGSPHDSKNPDAKLYLRRDEKQSLTRECVTWLAGAVRLNWYNRQYGS